MKFAHWLMSLALITASFDVLLNFDFGGNVRFAQIMLLGVTICAFAKVLQERAVLWPRGGYALAAWGICQGLLITQSPAPNGSLVFYGLLLFTLIGIAATLQIYGRSKMIGKLMRVYLLSFVFVAVFGAYQFVSPALHLGHPLIVQWIKHGVIPRINGFSYEPSYFATYLIMGWITLMDLRASGAQLTRHRRWFWFLLLISAVLFFSTSKTAWGLMIVEGLARLYPRIKRILRVQKDRLLAGSLVVPLPRLRILVLLLAVAVFVSVGLAAVSQVVDPNVFLSGSGLNGTAAHSLNDRVAGFALTLGVIEQHFWVGRSLGGVAGTIALNEGARASTWSELRLFWGFPVPLEVFAASGFWTFLFFLWFFVAITRGERGLIREHWADERAKWLRALIRALIFEWLALCADQNLLRVYLWFHVTMVVVVGYSLRYYKDGEVLIPGAVTA